MLVPWNMRERVVSPQALTLGQTRPGMDQSIMKFHFYTPVENKLSGMNLRIKFDDFKNFDCDSFAASLEQIM